jgi:metal-responsive CopG/Arc/MetJ family transcriptional regulator
MNNGGEKTRKTAPASLRLNEELLKAVDFAAKDAGVTRNAWIRVAIIQSLRERGYGSYSTKKTEKNPKLNR